MEKLMSVRVYLINLILFFITFIANAVPPVLVSTNPINGAVGVATNANVELSFDVNIRKGTGFITLTPSPSGTPIVINVTSPTVNIVSGNTLRITGLTMVQNRIYEVTMPAGVVEEQAAPNDPFAGLAAGDYSFRTVAPAPVLTSHTPVHNATGIATNTNLIMNFDQDVAKGTGNIVITPILPVGSPINIDVASSDVTVSGSVVTVTGLSLNENTRYEVTMASGVLTGVPPASTPFSGIAANTWRFTTISPAPVLTATSPVHLAINIVTLPTLTLTFDRNVAKGTGNITITPVLPAGAPTSIPVSSGTVTVSGNTVSIFSLMLSANTTYQVTMPSGVITASNPDPTSFVGISAGDWEFTTLGNATVTAPTLNNLCRGANVYLPLGNIVINEVSRDNFEAGASQLLILNAPTDYEFQMGIGSVTASGDVTINSYFIASTKIFIIYSVSNTYNTIDNITISGLQVKANASAAASATVLRDVSSSAIIAGVTGATVFATLNSVALPAQPVLVAGTDTEFCVGENLSSVTFPITSAAGFNYEWYADASLTTLLVTKLGASPATASELGITTAAATTFNRYVVRVNTTTGCKSSPLHVVVQVYANPVVNIVSNEPDNAICQGEKQVTFTAFGSASSYQFYVNANPVTPAFGTVNTIVGGAELVTNLSLTAGTYTIYVVGTSNGCNTTSSTINFVVHSNPTVTYSPPTTTFYTSQTSGVALSGGSPAGGTYTGAGITGNIFYPNLIPGPYPTTTTITYNYTDANGCSGSDSRTVTVEESIAPILGLGPSMCQNDPDFVVALNPGLPNYTPTPTASSPSLPFSCTATDNKYRIIVIGSGNPAVLQYSAGVYTIKPSLAGSYPQMITFQIETCFNGTNATYYQSVIMHPSPTATISNVSNGQQFCISNPNLTVNFNVSGGSGGGSGTVEIRQLPGGSFTILPANTINFTSLVAGTNYELRLTYVDAVGCGSTDLKTFSTYPNPVPDFTILPTSVLCQGAVDLYLDPTTTRDPSHPDFGTNPPATFINSKGYFSIFNASGTSLLAIYANGDNHLTPAETSFMTPGNYILRYTYEGYQVCNIASFDRVITINSRPNPSFTFPGGNTSYQQCENINTITLNPTPAMGANDRFFMRKDGGSFIPQPLATNVLTLSGAGTYEIYYFYTDLVTGCSNTSSTQVLTLTPLPAVNFVGLAPQYCVDATSATLNPIRSNGSIVPANGYFTISRTTPAFTQNLPNGVNTFNPSTLPGVGTYQVTYTYTDENGCTNTSAAQSFNLVPLPTPSFTGLATAYCVSASPVMLVGTPAGGSFQVRRVSPTATAFESIGTSFNPAAPLPSDPLSGSPTLAERNSKAGVYQVRYVFTDANGCTGFSPVQSVTINPLPDIDFVFTSGSNEYCIDVASVSLTPSRANGVLVASSGFFRIQRASPAFSTDLAPGANTFTPSILGMGAGSYNITYHYNDENACQNVSAAKTIIIHPLPNPSFAGLASAYCLNALPVTLSPLPAAGGVFRIRRVAPTTTSFEVFSGVLDPSQPLPSSPLPPSPTILDRNSKAGTYEITYTYTDANGCTNTSPAQQVVLHELPNVDFLFPGGISAYCIDYGSITLTPTRANGSIVAANGFFTISQGAFSLQLANGQNSFNITTQLTPGAGNYNIVYTYTDENNCTFSSLPHTLTVYPLPTPDFSGLASAYCVSASPIVLTPLPASGGTFRIRKILPISEATSFETLPGGILDPSQPLPSNPLPPSPTLAQRNSKAGVYEITYTYTDGNGCINTSAAKQVTINPLPVIDFDFAGGINAYCVDATNVTLIPSRSNGSIVAANGYFTISRVTPAFSLTLPNGQNSFNPSTQLAGAGTYEINYYYTDENTCSNISDSKTLIINPLPNLTLTGFVAGTPPTYCVNSADFVINAFNNGNPIAIPDPNATFRIRRIAPFVTSFEVFGGTLQPSQPLPSSPLSSNPTVAERNSKAGTYEVSFTFVDGNNCSNTVTQQIIIQPIPVVTFLFPFSDKDHYCQDQGNITLVPLLEGNPVSNPSQGYFTFTKGAFVLNLPNGVHTINITTQLYANAGLGDYEVAYTYTNNTTNCTNTSPVRVLRINPLPILTFDFPRPNGIDEDNTYCESATNVTLTPIWLNAGGNPLVASSGYFQFAHQDGTFTYQLPNGVNSLNPLVNLVPPSASSVKIGIYNVTYTYTDLNGCTNTSPARELRIYPLPQIDFSYSNACFGDSTTFVANINLPTFDTNDGIVEIKWEFGDGVTRTFSGANLAQGYSIKHRFAIPITYQTRLTVTSLQGCSNNILKNIRIGAIPVADFTTGRFCQGDFVQFTSTSTIAPTDSIATVIWRFGDGNEQTINIYSQIPALSPHTQHQYATPGEYEAELITISTLGCSDTIRRQVFIFPNVVVTPTTPYKENFETSTGGWLANGTVAGVPKMYSWTHAVPNGVKINASNSTRAWICKRPDSTKYMNNEQSYVESPCFDIAALQRPMLQMKIFYDTDQGGDGVVVQISRDDGATWEVLGNVGEGIDWYNTTGIAGLPGGQGLKGWSGRTLNNWVIARYPLDAYQGESKLRFRLAFGSNADNLTSAPFDGFAFDEIFIGERNRRVLLEHFTNTSNATANSENDWIDTQFVGVQNGEAIKIQYHTSFPAADPINANNNADPSARALYYGVSQVPRTSIDGFIKNESQFSTWGTPVYNTRVLLQSPFAINITYPSNPSELLNISAEITALEPIDSSLIAQVVVVEREIPASVFTNVNLGSLIFRNVVKRMLPDAAGTRINQVWQQGSRVVINQSWNPVNVYDKEKLAVVVFLQNEANKSVYQAFLSDVSTRPSGITSLPTELLQNFVLYPNPTRDKVIVGFEGVSVPTDYQVKIFDQLGRLVKESTILQGEQGVVVEVGNLAEGMYLLRLQNEKGELLTRKFSVIR